MRRFLFFRGALQIPCVIFAVGCTTLAQKENPSDTAALSEAYKNFRSQKKRSLYIQNFDNRTYAPQLTGRLKEKLQILFASTQSTTLTTDKNAADLILYGKILLYSEESSMFFSASQAQAYNLYVVASVHLRARVEQKNAKENTLYEKHDVEYTTTYNTGPPFYENRFTAEERMLDGLANRIAGVIFDPKVAP